MSNPNRTARPPANLRDVAFGVQQSRRLLIDTIRAFSAFADGLTVIGAHAVHVWVKDALGAIPMQATRDADVAVNPVFVTPDPKFLEVMEGIGVEPALPDRPGIYGYTAEKELPLPERTTIDLIVPEAYAGPGRRAARIAGQERAASRATGLELTVWDRHLRTLAAIDDPADTVDAWVAGPAALLVAKAHKVHERLAQLASRPDRLRPKDSGDIALLMIVSQPGTVAEVMASQSAEHPEIAAVVSDAAKWLVEMYSDPSGVLRRHAADALAGRFDEAQVGEAIETWLARFRDAAAEVAVPGS
jgi:hypothetical protein